MELREEAKKAKLVKMEELEKAEHRRLFAQCLRVHDTLDSAMKSWNRFQKALKVEREKMDHGKSN